MKIMDTSMEDDCRIELASSAKKKKMKQAQLPFHMLSSLESSNVISNKKRKLTSPSIEYKCPKVVKIAKENVSQNAEEEKLNISVNSVAHESSEEDIKEDIENEPIYKQSTSEKVETPNKKLTPRRNSVGKGKKFNRKDTERTSVLTKFLKKSDKEEVVKEDEHNSSLQDEKSSESCNDKSNVESEMVLQSMDTLNDTNNSGGNDSSTVQSDSDVNMLSSENEDSDEQKKLNGTEEKNTTIKSPRTPRTPRNDRSMEMAKQKKLTPKQQEKKLQSAKKKEERERLRMEKEKKLEEERESRRKEKEEKRKEKEEKDKVEKEQKMKEKKLKEMKKQMEIEQKQKEKEAKEEERRKKEEAKEEEKRKKEEEKLEAERKKQKAASNFASFFVAKKQETKSMDEDHDEEARNFMPFEVKADMKIAPVCRRVLNEHEKSSLDKISSVNDTKKSKLYLGEIKDGKVIPRKSGKTWPLEAKDELMIIDEENEGTSNIVDQNPAIEKQRPKLLQFTENRRPPYWGTWRKSSSNINPRKPFSKDTNWFNYEVDSDDEWEEEEPGESLHGSDDEKDEENPEDNEYDVDNEFMVPHGYLSDEEARADEEDKEDMSPETQKFKLQVLGEQFESERNTKTSKLKPKIVGCIWQGQGNTFSENVPQRIVDFLQARQAWVRQIPVTLPSKSENEPITGNCSTPTQQGQSTSKKTKVPHEALADLIRLIHGNTHGRRFLMKEFMTYWSKKNKVGENQISKASLSQKIREIGRWMACPEEGPMHLKACWYVTEDTRKEHLLEELTLPNRWSYLLTPKRKSDVLDVERPEKEDRDKEKKNIPLITQFTKKITQEEMKRQLAVKSSDTPSAKTPQQKVPKRVALISVARGEQFVKSRENLLKKFVDSNNENVSISTSNHSLPDVIVIDSSDEAETDKEAGNTTPSTSLKKKSKMNRKSKS